MLKILESIKSKRLGKNRFEVDVDNKGKLNKKCKLNGKNKVNDNKVDDNKISEKKNH